MLAGIPRSSIHCSMALDSGICSALVCPPERTIRAWGLSRRYSSAARSLPSRSLDGFVPFKEVPRTRTKGFPGFALWKRPYRAMTATNTKYQRANARGTRRSFPKNVFHTAFTKGRKTARSENMTAKAYMTRFPSSPSFSRLSIRTSRIRNAAQSP